MPKSLSEFLAAWMQRDPAYRERLRQDRNFAREEMTRADLPLPLQEVLLRADMFEIREELQRELKEDRGYNLPLDFLPASWGRPIGPPPPGG
jgi:hypothetical protein